MRWAVVALALVLVACATETPEQKAAARLAKAEAALAGCKQRAGLAGVPTPDTAVLEDPATRGSELTPEAAGQLRLKVQCRLELDELLAARKAAGK